MSRLERDYQRGKLNAARVAISDIWKVTLSLIERRLNLGTFDSLSATWRLTYGTLPANIQSARDFIRHIDCRLYATSCTTRVRPETEPLMPGHPAFYTCGLNSVFFHMMTGKNAGRKLKRSWMTVLVELIVTAAHGVDNDEMDWPIICTRVLYHLLVNVLPTMTVFMMDMTADEFDRAHVYPYAIDNLPSSWLNHALEVMIRSNPCNAFSQWPEARNVAPSDARPVCPSTVTWSAQGLFSNDKNRLELVHPGSWKRINTYSTFLISMALSRYMILRHIPPVVVSWIESMTPGVVSSPSFDIVHAVAYGHANANKDSFAHVVPVTETAWRSGSRSWISALWTHFMIVTQHSESASIPCLVSFTAQHRVFQPGEFLVPSWTDQCTGTLADAMIRPLAFVRTFTQLFLWDADHGLTGDISAADIHLVHVLREKPRTAESVFSTIDAKPSHVTAQWIKYIMDMEQQSTGQEKPTWFHIKGKHGTACAWIYNSQATYALWRLAEMTKYKPSELDLSKTPVDAKRWIESTFRNKAATDFDASLVGPLFIRDAIQKLGL